MDTNGKYYLGRIFEQGKNKTSSQPLLYDPDDLTTHAVIVGMTGSGKTGLGIDLLEEAALSKTPALLIDPKGDITNTLLHFPDLLPSDFEPWVNPTQADREGKSLQQASEDTANLWKNGLEEWGIGSDRIKALKESVDFTIYTPGSTSGIPISILTSLIAPDLSWEDNRELFLEKISGTVTALLGLIGMNDIDPVRSREHILLQNIFEHSWSRGQDLNLNELILQTQTPPFKKLGVFEVDTFFPPKERFELAMLLNNLLASPAFQIWLKGDDLDIEKLLYRKDGKPRHSVFYISHLSDAERMFFVTLLISTYEIWMRSTKGTSSLRSILYFDEIYGYLPPVANPPSKQPMLRMLKQARAFGVGLVLVTQNPSDVDYKALSNAGTWFVGKLQTETDKERLLDGLEGAIAGALDRKSYDQMISNLGKRVFLLHNVHDKPKEAGRLFQTRWAMNYLAGPLTRPQIPALNYLVGKQYSQEDRAEKASKISTMEEGSHEKQIPSKSTSKEKINIGTKTPPALPSGITEYFLVNNLTLSQAKATSDMVISEGAQMVGMIYHPTIIAQAQIRFFQQKYNLNTEILKSIKVMETETSGSIRWEDYLTEPFESEHILSQADSQIRFASLEEPFSNEKILKALEKDFVDWCYRNVEVMVKANEALKVYAGPDVSSEDFHELCQQEAQKQCDIEISKLENSFSRKLDSLEAKIKKEKRELEEDLQELNQRKIEEFGTHAETIISLFSSRKKRISSSLTKRRMTQKAQADVGESQKAIEDYLKQLDELEKSSDEALAEVKRHWDEIAKKITEFPIRPYKKDITLSYYGIAWNPFYLIKTEDRVVELNAFEKG